MQIIRIIWGQSKEIINEIPKKPLFDNELVYVWGKGNNDYLIKLGYKTVLISENTSEPKFSSHLTHFGHKIHALKLAEDTFDEYLFLDWDVIIVKELDENFYKMIREGNDIQCPLYAYNTEYKNEIEVFTRDNKGLENFVSGQFDYLIKYHWNYEDCMVIPCTCFYYSNNNKIMSTLLWIIDKFKLEAVCDEFSLFVYLSGFTTLDEYIEKYEPTVINGKTTCDLPLMEISINKINKYVASKIKKDIYLLHDV